MAIFPFLGKVAAIVATGWTTVSGFVDWLYKKGAAFLTAHKMWALFFFAALMLVVFNAFSSFIGYILKRTVSWAGLPSTVPQFLKDAYAILNVYFPADMMVSKIDTLLGSFVTYITFVKTQFLYRRVMRIYGIMCLGWKA